MVSRAPPELGGDCIIGSGADARRYAIFRDPKEGIMWKRVRSQEEEPGSAQPVIVKWNCGGRAGAGIINFPRTEQEVQGYAYTERMDASDPGFLRMSPRRFTVTPNASPSNSPTLMFEEPGSGDAVFETGHFTKSVAGAPASQTVTHSLGVTPKALMLWAVAKTAETVSAGLQYSQGFTDGTDSQSIFYSSDDAVNPPNVDTGRVAKLITIRNGSGTAVAEADFTSFSTTNFIINWTTNNASAYIIHYALIAGTDVSAKVIAWTTNTTTGNQSVTGAGFKPDTVLHLSERDNGTNGTSIGQAVMTRRGQQWAQSISAVDAISPTVTRSNYSASECLNVGPQVYRARFISMDDDGFTMNLYQVTSPAASVASLCLLGVQTVAGSFAKSIGAAPASQAITGFGFSPDFLMLAGTHLISGAADARFCIGAAASTTSEKALTVMDTDALAASSTDSVTKTTVIFIKVDNATQTIDAEATLTSFDTDGATFSWTTNDADADVILYWGLANLIEKRVPYLYILNGQWVYKNQVESNDAITVRNERDFGGNVSLGPPAKFETKWYLPMGAILEFRELTTIVNTTGNDTYTAATAAFFSLAFGTIQDGSTSRIQRGFSTNLTDLAATAPTTGGNWGGDFEVSETSAAITNIKDTGVATFVAKEDDCFKFTPEGVARRLFGLPTGAGNLNNGCGLVAIPETEVAFYNYGTMLLALDGTTVLGDVGPNAIPSNGLIPSLTLEPYGGTILEGDRRGNWLWYWEQVTESNVTRSYLWAGEMLAGPRLIRWQTADIVTGVCRGCFIDSLARLWSTEAGQIVYRQINLDGSPDAGRDNAGYGAASTQHRWIGPEIDLGPTLHQIDRFEVDSLNTGATTPILIQTQRDASTLVDVGAAVTTAGLVKRYPTEGTSDTVRRIRPVIDVTTTAGFVTTTDLQIFSLTGVFWPRPDKSGVLRIIINTGVPYANGAMPPDDAKTQRDTLELLMNGASVSTTDPDGNTMSLNITDVNDLTVRQDANGAVVYTIELLARERITA